MKSVTSDKFQIQAAPKCIIIIPGCQSVWKNNSVNLLLGKEAIYLIPGQHPGPSL